MEIVPISEAANSAEKKKLHWIVALGLVIVCGTIIRLSNLQNVTSRSPDEVYYTREASVVLDQGATKGLRQMASDFMRDSNMFNYPAPIRGGYIWVVAQAMAFTESRDELAGAYLSTIASIGSMLLLALIGWRFFRPPIALLALLFFIVSPVELSLARRAWQDALVEFLALCLLYIACRVTAGERRIGWFVVFGSIASLCVTVKETAVIVALMLSVWILWVLWKRRDRASILLFTGCMAAGLGAGLLWLAYMLGGFDILQAINHGVFAHRAMADTYSIEYESGSPIRLLEVLWKMSPAMVIGAILGLMFIFSGKLKEFAPESQNGVAVLFSLFVLIFLVMTVIYPHRINPRYIAVACGASYLIGGIGIYCTIRKALEWLRPTRRNAFSFAATALLIVAAISDYGTFQVFARTGIKDLSARMALDPEQNAAPPDTPPVDANRSVDIATAENIAASQPSPDNYLSLSLAYYNAARYEDCILASQKAIALKPDFAPAYNNICAANNMLRRFEEGKKAAEQALRIDPDNQLAKNNLKWSIDGMQGK